MLSCLGPETVPPTGPASRYVFLIKLLMPVQLLVSILDIAAHKNFLREGLLGLLLLMPLLMFIIHRLSYKAILIYCFGSIVFSVVFVSYVFKMYKNILIESTAGKTVLDADKLVKVHFGSVLCEFHFLLQHIDSIFLPLSRVQDYWVHGQSNVPGSDGQQRCGQKGRRNLWYQLCYWLWIRGHTLRPPNQNR